MNDLKKRIENVINLIDSIDSDDIVVEVKKFNEFDRLIFDYITKYNEVYYQKVDKMSRVERLEYSEDPDDFIINNTYNEIIKIPLSRIKKISKI